MTNRCVDILVGLNAGSEGKGKFMSILQDVPYAALVRTGGPNAAHTVEYKGKHFAFHTIPCGAFHFPNAKVVLGANAQIDIEHLKHEIEVLKEAGVWSDDRLMIDPNAVIIDPIDKIAENGGRMPDCGDLWTHPIDCSEHAKLGGTCAGCDKLPPDSAWKALGSTTHGVGANACRKAARGTKMVVLPGQKLDLAAYFRKKFGEDINYSGISEEIMKLMEGGPITDWGEFIEPEKVRYAEDDEFLKQFVGGTVEFLNRLIDNDKPILLEGTQGSVLSLHHGYRGKTTSRDTNASNWCADAGISPFAVRDVYGVTRTFPIRVAGDSGPMSGEEITWEEVTEHAESPEPIVEITTATKRKRRVFTLDRPDGKPTDLKKALDINRPTKLMLSFVDYLNYQDRYK
ncbi:MAG: adenylosuccinate synthetase [bacterium]